MMYLVMVGETNNGVSKNPEGTTDIIPTRGMLGQVYSGFPGMIFCICITSQYLDNSLERLIIVIDLGGPNFEAVNSA
jgi:hypothetical protein